MDAINNAGRAALYLALSLGGASACATEVYRWVDAGGTVHYSSEAPPAGVKASKVDVDAEPRAPVTESAECYTVRCQGDRLDQRLARREQIEARLAAERAALTPREPNGLDARRYGAIRQGMSEGEFVGVAGAPDLLLWDSRAVKTYTYYPTSSEPFTTTVILVNGRVTEVERRRGF